MQQKPSLRRIVEERAIFEAAVYSLRRAISSRVQSSFVAPRLRFIRPQGL
jgi:hypothetical protein